MVGLGVAKEYPRPPERRRLLLIGAIGILALAAYVLADTIVGRGDFLSNGPLSSAHANLESDCNACHTPLADVTGGSETRSEKCSVCHEKFGDELGSYSFAAHYVYRSGDFQRVAQRDGEVGCDGCHTEHRGRSAPVTTTADAQCVGCHEYGSFNSGHPEIGFAATATEDAPLSFAHVSHLREVMKREELVDLESGCLFCHNPRQDGRNFQPISFDRHCDACHLPATVATPRLPVESPDAPGVQSLEMILEERAPGSSWALFANPGEYRASGRSVRKGPLHHRDPWILHNLRRLRQLLYPDAGLADLLAASPDIPAERSRELYAEAIATLRQRVIELRSQDSPQLQRQLREIEGVIDRVEQQLTDPLSPLDETRFLVDLIGRAPGLDGEQLTEVELLVADLTEACRLCHEIEQATISRVAADQRTMVRAEFDHGAHIMERRCLDCHERIPFEAALRESLELDPSADAAEIVNLPTAEGCEDCHNARQVSNRCVTCHLFHPDQGRHANLLLYLEQQ